MNSIVEKGYAKINLGLDVTGRRPNGYHDLRMIMQTIDLYDTVTLEKTEEAGIFLTTDHPTLPCDQSNLMYKAAKIMTEKYALKEGVKIHLEKRIPMAAGLAGGSTDAACVFRGMNRLFELHLSADELRTVSLPVGADVPYCIEGGTALAEGIGEVLTALPALPAVPIVLLKPDFDVSTKYVYEHLDSGYTGKHPDITAQCEAVRLKNLSSMAKLMGNVLETVTVSGYPEIAEMKEELFRQGAYGAMMSGSGPSVYGLFTDEKKAGEVYRTMRDKYPTAQVFVTETKNPDYGL